MAQIFQHHQSIQIKISPSIRNQAAQIAEIEGVSLNYFISVALAEKMNRMESQNDYLRASE
jgi:predicted HicB family RNase H-like nuclease